MLFFWSARFFDYILRYLLFIHPCYSHFTTFPAIYPFVVPCLCYSDFLVSTRFRVSATGFPPHDYFVCCRISDRRPPSTCKLLGKRFKFSWHLPRTSTFPIYRSVLSNFIREFSLEFHKRNKLYSS